MIFAAADVICGVSGMEINDRIVCIRESWSWDEITDKGNVRTAAVFSQSPLDRRTFANDRFTESVEMDVARGSTARRATR